MLHAGTKLGPYEILAPIGAGGMGEVYRAKDTRLGRDVALKTLPAGIAKDEEQRARFEREARAASSLNHPNICAIYDVGTGSVPAPDGGETPLLVDYLVMELLDGETAADAVARGPMPVADVMRLGAEIADALDRAHRKGLVHRDLKPANIMLVRASSKSGPVHAKLLDFGLARPTSANASSETMTKALTAAGSIVGTFQYMSPEQVEGREVDGRTDIWSLGATLYEMATGARAFDGASTASLISAVMRDEPKPMAERVPLTPPAFQRVIAQCLAKDADDRWQSAGDVKRELDWIGGGGGSGSGMPAAAARPVRRRSPALIAASFALIALAAAAAWFLRGPGASPLPTIQRLTFRRGTIQSARFEPGTTNVVYAASWQSPLPEVFSVHPQSPESRAVGQADALLLAVSARQEIAVLLSPRLSSGVFAGTLATMPLGGGGARELATRVVAADFMGEGGQLAIVDYTGDRARVYLPVGNKIYETGDLVNGMRCAPRGGLIALATSRGLVVIDQTGAEKARMSGMRPSGMAWTPDGSEIWYSQFDGPGQSTILAVKPGGVPRTIWRGSGLALADVAANGVALVVGTESQGGVFVQRAGSTDIVDLGWLDRSFAVDVSPAGDALLLNEIGDAGGDFYMRKLDGSAAVRLGSGLGLRWSPKGDAVLARKDPQTFLVAPVGAGTTREWSHPNVWAQFGWFSPDGRILMNGRANADEPYRFSWLDESGKVTPAGPPGIDHWAWQDVFSHDGRRIVAFLSGQTGMGKVAIYPLDGGAAEPVVGLLPKEVVIQFTADDRHLLVYDRDRLPARIYQLDYRTGQRTLWREFSPSDPAGIRGFQPIVMTADGRVVAYSYIRSLGTAYLISGLR